MLLLVSMLAGWAHPAAAQAGVRLSTLQVSLWPEYDRPSTLVILEGQLEPTVALPASLALRIPARAGQPHAVAVTDEGGQLLTAAYTTQPAGDDIIVMFQTEFQGFRVEYYDPALKSDGKARQYAFEWQTDYAIAAAAVRVQQPLGARDLAGEPALHSLGAVEDGLTYFEADWGALEPGDTASLRLSYAKTGSTLTAEALAAAPAPQAVTPAVQGNNLPWIIGGAALGLALAAGGVFAYTRPRRPAPAPRQPTRRRSSAGRRRVKATPAAHCTQCGQRLVAGDRFCRNCGARAVVS